MTLDAEKLYRPPPPLETCVYSDLAYQRKKTASTGLKVAAMETKETPPPPAPKPLELEETMTRFAKMILDGMKKMQGPTSASNPPTLRNSPSEGGGAKKKTGSSRRGGRSSTQCKRASSSSDSSGDERPKRSSKKGSKEGGAAPPSSFYCYYCGAPSVIRRNCPKCQGNGQPTK